MAAGGGAGRALMAAAEDWARDQERARMTLEVFASNAAARAAYARLGYARLGYAEQTLKLAKTLRAQFGRYPGQESAAGLGTPSPLAVPLLLEARVLTGSARMGHGVQWPGNRTAAQ
jgi:Acetyltransferase (GNAT) family